jgi:hypothetical protein
MTARNAVLVLAIGVSIFIPSQLLAQSRTDRVCWADDKNRCPAPWNGSDIIQIPCGSGGNSGFNPAYACQQTCGAPVGPKCRITGGPGGDGGQCGYRAAQIDCFN